MSEDTEPDKGQPDVAAELAKIRDENKRLVKALQSFQAKDQEFEKLKTEFERSKLSEEEKRKAEQDEIKRERDRYAAEAKEAQERLAIQEKVNDLVAVHKLKNPEFGPILLKHLKEDEDMDAFAARMKASPKYRDVFEGQGNSDDEPVRDKAKAPPLRSAAGSSRAKGAEVTEEDKAFVQRRWPNDPERQKRVLARLLDERKRGE